MDATFSITGYILTDTIGKDYLWVKTREGENFLFHTHNLYDLFGTTSLPETVAVIEALGRKLVTVSGTIGLYRSHLSLYADEVKVFWKHN